MQPFLDSSLVLGDMPELRARMARDGYLFLPGLMPRAPVAALQAEIGAIARDAGWLVADAPVE